MKHIRIIFLSFIVTNKFCKISRGSLNTGCFSLIFFKVVTKDVNDEFILVVDLLSMKEDEF